MFVTSLNLTNLKLVKRVYTLGIIKIRIREISQVSVIP